MCEQPEHLVVVAGVTVLEPLGRASVQLRALRTEQRAVCRFLDERMLEAILRLRPPPALLQETESLQFVERIDPAVLDDAFEQRQRESTAERGCGGKRVMRLRRQPVEPREDRSEERR